MTSRGRPISGSETDLPRIKKRTRTAKNQLSNLAKIAPELDPMTFTEIQKQLEAAITDFQKAYRLNKV